MNDLNIIIAGLGTVGSSLMKYLEMHKDHIELRINKNINICGISAKNKNKKRSFLVNNYKWFDNPKDMINNTNSDIFIELMGYEKNISYECIKLAIEKKINIITANKALIANYGNELFSLADRKNVSFLYEASVAGGIPIIKTLKSLLLGNNITKISGILNGTTNYILSNMTNNKISFNNALIEAKKNGYAESNPDLDIEGVDSAHKLSILSSLAFTSKFTDFKNIYKEGISKIDTLDIDFANKLNLTIKLLAVAELQDNHLVQYVKPMLIDKNSQLGQVSDVLNGIQISSEKSGNIFLEGEGAGGMATASSIISDIGTLCLESATSSLGIKQDSLKKINELKYEDQCFSFYIRLIVIDKPGVLAEITSVLKDNDISVQTMFQNPKKYELNNNNLPIMFTTHETYLKNVNNCIKKIVKMQNVKDKPVVIQIYKV